MLKEEFDEYCLLSLDEKIEKSYEIIEDFYYMVDENSLYISSSFGKDSLVLNNGMNYLHMVYQIHLL